MFDTSRDKLEKMDALQIAVALGLLGQLIKEVAEKRDGNEADLLDAMGCILISIPMYLIDETIGEDGLEVLHTVAHIVQMATTQGRTIEQVEEVYRTANNALMSGMPFVTGRVGSSNELDAVAQAIRNAMVGQMMSDEPLDPKVAEWLAIMGKGKMGTD